jgi:hypothetical protein
MIVSQPQIPTSYRNLSPNPSLVAKVVDPVFSLVTPTLPFKSEIIVVNLVPSSVDPTLPLKSELKVVNSIPSSADPTLSLKSEILEVDLTP